MRSIIKIIALPAAISLHMVLRLVFTPAFANEMEEPKPAHAVGTAPGITVPGVDAMWLASHSGRD